jgi:hypothetical protein
LGKAIRKGRRMTMVTGSANAACGSTTPQIVLTSCRSRTIRNNGTMATAIGNIRPSVNRENSASRPRNSYRASGYAAITPSTTTTAVVTTAIRLEFSAYRQKAAEPRTFR